MRGAALAEAWPAIIVAGLRKDGRERTVLASCVEYLIANGHPPAAVWD